jgi:hypothetical protein
LFNPHCSAQQIAQQGFCKDQTADLYFSHLMINTIDLMTWVLVLRWVVLDWLPRKGQVSLIGHCSAANV